MRGLLFIFSIVLLFSSCAKDAEDDSPTIIDTISLVSFYGGTISHYQGENCPICHQEGGEGKGWFNISGTVYDTTLSHGYANATVNIFDGINGTGNLIYSIECDSFGNFYSTNKIEFGSGLYAVVDGEKISAKMGSLVTKGSCNNCHGVTTNRIWTK